MDPTKQREIKRALGAQAATYIQDGMLVGLGTGTTAAYFIESLIERCKQGLKIRAVSSSLASAEQARKGGIPLLNMDEVTEIDFTVDGADEVDPQNRMIKGGGGAHVREKILASSSKQTLFIVDSTKVVEQLGAFGLPVEILPFGSRSTLHKLSKMGYEGTLRPKSSDNGNLLFDIRKPALFTHPEEDEARILSIPGVVDTGFFFQLAPRVLIGYAEGKFKLQEV